MSSFGRCGHVPTSDSQKNRCWRPRNPDRRRPAQLPPGEHYRDVLRIERDQRCHTDARLPIHDEPRRQCRPRPDIVFHRPPARRVLRPCFTSNRKHARVLNPFVPAKAGTQFLLDSRFRGNERNFCAAFVASRKDTDVATSAGVTSGGSPRCGGNASTLATDGAAQRNRLLSRKV
jgi:hypothetical protein